MRYLFQAPVEHTLDAGGVLYHGGEEVPEALACALSYDSRIVAVDEAAPREEKTVADPPSDLGASVSTGVEMRVLEAQEGVVDAPGEAINAQSGVVSAPGEALPAGEEDGS